MHNCIGNLEFTGGRREKDCTEVSGRESTLKNEFLFIIETNTIWAILDANFKTKSYHDKILGKKWKNNSQKIKRKEKQ